MLSFFTYYADGTHPVRQNAGKIVIRDCVSHGPVRLRFKDCELGYDQPVRSLLIGSFIGEIEIDGLDVRGVDGPLVRLWNADAVRPEMRIRRMKGVTGDVMPENGSWKVHGI